MFDFTTINKRKGFTLPEIMISLVISSFILGAIIHVYLSNKASYFLNEQLIEMQANARFSTSKLRNDIRMSGYFEDINNPIDPFVRAKTLDNEITIQKISDVDCIGNPTPVATPRLAENHYFISDGDLYCDGNGTTGQILLVEGVHQMQLLYGVDENDSGGVSRWLRPNHLTSTYTWNKVVAVKVALLISTPREVKAEPASRTHYMMYDSTDTNDRRIYKVYYLTVPIKNRL